MNAGYVSQSKLGKRNLQLCQKNKPNAFRHYLKAPFTYLEKEYLHLDFYPPDGIDTMKMLFAAKDGEYGFLMCAMRLSPVIKEHGDNFIAALPPDEVARIVKKLGDNIISKVFTND